MQGVGRTVFSRNRIDEFQVEILGVLKSMESRESEARIRGGQFNRTDLPTRRAGLTCLSLLQSEMHLNARFHQGGFAIDQRR